MDRGRTAEIERAEILGRFPEFACLTRRVPFLTKRQNALMLARLARMAMRLKSGCIAWGGNCTNDGYGRMTVWVPALKARKSVPVHQIVLRMKTGRALPEWQETSHTCNTPPCFHPAHVFAERIKFNRVRSAENTNRKKARGDLRARIAAQEIRV